MANNERQEKEYYKIENEFNTRLSRIDNFEKKITEGLKLITRFQKLFDTLYPLHKLGDENLVNFLRENEDNVQVDEKGKFYYVQYYDGKIVSYPKNENYPRITKTEIDDAINASTVLRKMKEIIEGYEDEIEIQKRLASTDNLDTDDNKVDYLTDLEFSDETENFRGKDVLKSAIRKRIEAIQSNSKMNSTKSLPKLTLGIERSDLVELIITQFKDKTFIYDDTKEPAKLKDIIEYYEVSLGINLSSYHQLRKTVLTYKKAIDGKTYLRRLNSLLEEEKKEMGDSEARIPKNS